MRAHTSQVVGHREATKLGGDDFSRLVDPYRRELHLHCYRILGSLADAEDTVQETLLAAWQGISSFEGRSSIRTWLYRIATTRCLNMLRSRTRRRWQHSAALNDQKPTRRLDFAAIDPYPDAFLEAVPDRSPGPEARYEALEATSLAFVATLQLLPARQRAVVILRDVLGFHSAEVAAMLEATDESVNSALKRARATLRRHLSATMMHAPSADEREVVERLTRAFEAGDVAGIVALLTDDVKFVMPPDEYDGRAAAAGFLAVLASTLWTERGPRLLATRANGQPAFGLYTWDNTSKTMKAMGVLVVTLAGAQVQAMSRYHESVLTYFGLPQSLE